MHFKYGVRVFLELTFKVFNIPYLKLVLRIIILKISYKRWHKHLSIIYTKLGDVSENAGHVTVCLWLLEHQAGWVQIQSKLLLLAIGRPLNLIVCKASWDHESAILTSVPLFFYSKWNSVLGSRENTEYLCQSSILIVEAVEVDILRDEGSSPIEVPSIAREYLA